MTPARGRGAATDAELLAHLERGETLAQAGAAFGISKEAVRARLARLGLRTAGVRNVRCDFCGALLTRAHAATGDGKHGCSAPACANRRRGDRLRAARAAPSGPPAHCFHCDRPLRRLPRADGVPSFCAAPACKAARSTWRYQHDPVYRAAALARMRAQKEGVP